MLDMYTLVLPICQIGDTKWSDHAFHYIYFKTTQKKSFIDHKVKK